MLITALGAMCVIQEVPPTYWNTDVAPVIAKNCASCHHDGGSAPFPLLERTDVARRGSFILKVIDAGRMPPWLPGEEGLELSHSREMPALEREVLGRWLAEGALAGEGEAITVRVPEKPEMRVDLTREMSTGLELPEETPAAYHSGEMDKHAFRFIMANAKPLRVRAIRATSNAPQTSRVMTVLVEDEGGVRALDHQDPLLGWRTAADVGYIPGGSHGMLLVGGDHLRLPRGYHWDYPPRSELALGVHYRPTGRVEVLKEKLDFELVPEEEASRPLRWLPAVSIAVDVPAGDVVEAQSLGLVIPVDVDLVALTPRAIEICVNTRLVAEFPDGSRRVLLSIPDWDHHSRETYILQKPLRLPAGTLIKGTWALENTAENPRNPDNPPIDIARRRRAGILSYLLHVAAVDEDDEDMLKGFGVAHIRSAQRQ